MCASKVNISIYKDDSLVEEFDTHIEKVTEDEHSSSTLIVCHWPQDREARRGNGELRATISRKMEKWQMNEAHHDELQYRPQHKTNTCRRNSRGINFCANTCGPVSHSRKYRKYFRGTLFETCKRTFANMSSHLPPPSVWVQWLYSHTPDANT